MKRRDYDPQFPDRQEGSFLKPVLASTPLVAGAAYSISAVARDGTIKQPREAGIDQAMDHLISRPYDGPPIPTQRQVQDFMRGQSADVNRQAWKWAMQTIDPFSRKNLRNFATDISSMTGTELESAISLSVSENTSGIMGKIYRRFQTNVNMLRSQELVSGSLPVFTSVEDLTAFATKTYSLGDVLPDPFQQRIAKIKDILGGTSRVHGISSAAAEAEGLGVWNVILGSEVGEFKVQLPQVSEGILLEGSYLQTRRIAPDILHKGTEETGGKLTRMSRTEFFLKELEESIAPDIGTRLKTQRDVEQAVKQLKTKVFGELEAVPNILAEGRTAAQARREAMRGLSVDVVMQEEVRKKGLEYKPGFRKPTDKEISKLLLSEAGERMGLRGGVAPDALMKGRLSTVDWERLYIGDVDYGRRPEQPYREFQATRQTLENLGQTNTTGKFRASEIVAQQKAYANVVAPKVKALYVNPEMYAKQLEQVAMGEGESLMLRDLADKIQFEESKTVKLADVRADIDQFKQFQPGEVLGTTREGKVFTLPQGAEITNVRRMGDDVLQLEMIQKHQFRHGEKVFGGAKAVTLTREAEEFNRIRKLFGASQEVDMIINMDELKKNRSLHKAQIISSLEEATKGNWMRNMGEKWAKESTHNEFIQKAMTASIQDYNISRAEFAETFGAVPYVLGDKEAAAGLVKEAMGPGAGPKRVASWIGAMLGASDRAGGMAALTYGGPRLEAGVMGSLESRAMDILSGGAFGQTGKDIASEFAERLRATNPEAFIAHQEMGKTLAGLAGETLPPNLRPYQPGTSFQRFIETGGGVIKPGHGLKDIYVPSASTMQAMRPFETPSGVQARGAVSDIYHDIAYKSRLLAEEAITPKEFQKEMDFATDLLRKEWAPAGKGIGSLARGKVLGSQFLRGVSAMEGGADTAIREARTIGITRGAFRRMHEEMVESGLFANQAAEMKRMAQIFETGGTVSGMLARHPFIGEFSLQPTNIKMVEGADDLVVLPEIKRDIEIKKPGGGVTSKSITFGPLVGLAGDKDADAYSVMMLSPRNEQAVRANLMQANSEFAKRYSQHQIRMQLFTPKANVESKALDEASMSVRELMAANVEKQAAGQRWIAPLSERMTEAKRALTRFGQGTAAADARFLTEWLEQNPIGAKHLSARQAAGGGLEALMTSISDSMANRKASRLESSINTIVANNEVAGAMLNQRLTITPESAKAASEALGGTPVGTELPSINVKAATQELMRSLEEADASGYTREGELLAGRGDRVARRELPGLAAKTVTAALTDGPGLFSKVSTAMQSATNRLGTLGRGVIKHHKAIGLGFAGSLALSAALSAPPTTVGPGREKIPNSRLLMNQRKAANRMKQEDMMPPQQQTGNPTAPNLVQNQTVRMRMNQPRTSANIRMQVPAGADERDLRTRLSGLGNNTTVNLRDSRSDMHPREITSKLL